MTKRRSAAAAQIVRAIIHHTDMAAEVGGISKADAHACADSALATYSLAALRKMERAAIALRRKAETEFHSGRTGMFGHLHPEAVA